MLLFYVYGWKSINHHRYLGSQSKQYFQKATFILTKKNQVIHVHLKHAIKAYHDNFDFVFLLNKD